MSYSARLDTSNAHEQSCVVALHCSLGSGRQWTRLTEALGGGYRVMAPDLSGYGRGVPRPYLPVTLADEGGCLTLLAMVSGEKRFAGAVLFV